MAVIWLDSRIFQKQKKSDESKVICPQMYLFINKQHIWQAGNVESRMIMWIYTHACSIYILYLYADQIFVSAFISLLKYQAKSCEKLHPIHIHTPISHIFNIYLYADTNTGWQWPVWCLKSHVIFRIKPLIIGLFCGKWATKVWHPKTLRHPIYVSAFIYLPKYWAKSCERLHLIYIHTKISHKRNICLYADTNVCFSIHIFTQVLRKVMQKTASNILYTHIHKYLIYAIYIYIHAYPVYTYTEKYQIHLQGGEDTIRRMPYLHR